MNTWQIVAEQIGREVRGAEAMVNQRTKKHCVGALLALALVLQEHLDNTVARVEFLRTCGFENPEELAS